MDQIVIPMGDFLKNAGIAGLYNLLSESDADEGADYGITDDAQGIWLDQNFAAKADWTSMYFHAFVEQYGQDTVYQAALEKIDGILTDAQKEDWNPSNCKDDLKFINDKLLSNSYKSGFENIKGKIENPAVYESLKSSKLKEAMGRDELCGRLRQLREFLSQPLCRETFCMKSIIYNYINRFWDGKSFLLRSNAAKDMREVFHADFSEPVRKYAAARHDRKKELCIDCSAPIDSKEKVSIAFMKDQADDLSRKRSTFWNCKVDAYLCPVCAFVYSLAPLGFTLVGNKFVFINTNTDVNRLIRDNKKSGKFAKDAEQREDERYSSWIARTLGILMQEKTRELSNIQIIARGRDESDRYVFDVVGRDVLLLLNDQGIQSDLEKLSQHPYVKLGGEYWNVHEEVMLNILRYHKQYRIVNKLLKLTMDTEGLLATAVFVYDIQLRTSLIQNRKENGKIGGTLMNRYKVREDGYNLRNALLGAKGTEDDACIRGMVYQLLNALSVGNVEHFMEILMRVYCSTKLQVPNAFIDLLGDHDAFVEYGYAFLLGLQGSHYVKKEEINNG